MHDHLAASGAKKLSLAAAIVHYLDESGAPDWKRRGAKLIQKSSLGLIRLQKLTTADLQRWCDRRLDHVCMATVQNDLRLIRLAYEAARRAYDLDLPSNPALGVELSDRARKLTQDELEALCTALENAPAVRALVIVAAETGLPRGALTSAQWRDVELDRTVLHLRERSTGPIVRSVPLSDAAANALRTLGKTRPRVFPMPVATIRLHWERACRRAKLRHVRFFEARHVLPYEGKRT